MHQRIVYLYLKVEKYTTYKKDKICTHCVINTLNLFFQYKILTVQYKKCSNRKTKQKGEKNVDAFVC